MYLLVTEASLALIKFTNEATPTQIRRNEDIIANERHVYGVQTHDYISKYSATIIETHQQDPLVVSKL